MPKKLSPAREKKLKELIHSINEANKDPQFRKAVREFIAYHTGTGKYSN